MKKIKLIISIMLFLTPTICFAKEIKINRVNYDVADVLELDGLIYNAESDTIILNNADIGVIQSENDLNIIVNGENTITNTMSVSECIKGKVVNITGSGKLNLISKSRGISANQLDINNTTIIGDVSTSMFFLTGDNTNLNIVNSSIVFKSNEAAFYIVNGSATIIDSNVIIEKTFKITHNEVDFINIINSTFDVIETKYFLAGVSKINVDSNSKVFIHCLNEFNENKLFGENIKYLGSVDNNFYHESITINDRYLKVIPAISLEDELNNLLIEKENLQQELNQIDERSQELDRQEESNNIKEKQLENKELELLELDEGLNKKEEELVQKESDFLISSNTLD